MALTLAYSVTERNDNKILTITDISGEVSTGTATGWGAPNAVYTTIVASGGAHTLELNLTITTSEGVSTTYDKIDLFTEFAPGGGFAAVTDLVFPLDCSMLTSGGVALGTSADEFPDGVYQIEYVYDDTKGTESTTSTYELVEGKVRNDVYELSRTIPVIYNCKDCKSKEILDVIFSYGLLNSMNAANYVAKHDELINQLYTLERIIINGSSYTW